MKFFQVVLFISCLIASDCCFSQSDFREGFLINQEKDTIHGLIDYKGSLRNLSKCRFKSDKVSEVREYSPSDIIAFRVLTGGFYRALDVEVNGKLKRLFVEQLIDGIVDIYYYNDVNEGEFLIQTEDGKLYNLVNTTKNVEIDGNTYEMDKKEYVGTLKILFEDSPVVAQKLDKIDFDPRSLTKIALEYHNSVCDYDCIIYTKEQAGFVFDLGIIGGYSVSSFELKSEYFERMMNDFSSSQDPFFGITINAMHPNISQRFGLELDMIWQNSKYVFDSTHYSMNYFKVPLILNYSYPVHKLKPTFQLGLSYNKWLKYSAQNIIPEHIIGDEFQSRKYQYGFLIGAKLSYELASNFNLYVNLRYESYKGKPWNTYRVPSGPNQYTTISESVDTRINFVSYAIGLHF